MSINIVEIIETLSRETRGIIAIQYQYPDVWYVLASYGDVLVVIPDTCSNDLTISLEMAWKRWVNRSPDYPFLHKSIKECGREI